MSFLSAWTRAAGMSTDKWMQLPVRTVPVTALTPTQQISAELWHARRPNEVTCRDPYPHIVRIGAVLYLEDGHHRWARARRDHADTIQARILEL